MATQARKDEYPGAEASKPQEIPMRGWLQIVRRAWTESSKDQMPLLAAGVAFYSFLSLFPAMIAAVMVYGLVADPKTVAEQTQQLTEALPDEAASLIGDQLKTITETPQQSLGSGLLVALALALWSAAGGVGNIVMAINTAYDEEETRGFAKRKALALGLTLGAIVFVIVAIGLVAVAPALLEAFVPSGASYWLLQGARWAVLVLAVPLVLAVLYRLSPDRADPKFQWVSAGAVIATVIWLVASAGFSFYVDNFGSYGKTYGALAGVVVLLLWLWITNFVVLLGAEINAEAELQTVKDTTTGKPQPLGERNAIKADNLPTQSPRHDEAMTETDRIARRIVVQGRVQGVFYRVTCQREAEFRSVAGWVRNRPDGKVEALFEGLKADVEQLIKWARVGPENAIVEKSEVDEVDSTGLTRFEVLD